MPVVTPPFRWPCRCAFTVEHMRCDAFTVCVWWASYALCLPIRNAWLPHIFEWIPMSVVVCVYVHHNLMPPLGRFAFDIVFTCSGSSVQSVPKIFEGSACRPPFHIEHLRFVSRKMYYVHVDYSESHIIYALFIVLDSPVHIANEPKQFSIEQQYATMQHHSIIN